MCLLNQGTEDFKILLFILKEGISSKSEKPAEKNPAFLDLSNWDDL